MSQPLGDLPDWTVATAPLVIAASKTGVNASANLNIFSSPNPFRVWGLWIASVLAADNTYVAALLRVEIQIADGSGRVLLAAEVAIEVPSTGTTAHIAIPAPGITPVISASTYSVAVITSAASATGVISKTSAGIWYSQP